MQTQSAVLDAPVAVDQKLDQRQYQRHEVSRSATVTVLGADRQVLHGSIQNVSQGGSQFCLDEPVSAGALVKIEYDDNLLLGEVVYCQAEQIGWLVGVKVEHALSGLTALAKSLEDYQ
jgi:hypothetical protein